MNVKFLRTILISGCAFLAGCATPLQTETIAPQIAKMTGVPSSDIVFVSYCSFGEAPPSGHHVSFTEGIIALSRNTLFLIQGDLAGEVAHRIGFSEMLGVDVHHFGRGRQLQIRTNRSVMVIEVSKNRQIVDAEGTEKARQILQEHGVANWKSDTHYLMKTKIPIIVPVPL